MKSKSISIVIPAYNEERRIESTLASIHEYLKKSKSLWNNPEVIVVADGCSDNTERLVLGIRETFPELKLLSYPENKGKGYALKTGIAASTGEIVLFTDADGATPIEELDQLVVPILTGAADIVIGSRRTSDAIVVHRQPIHRRILGKAFSVAVRTMLGTTFKDTQCGFKVFHGDVARKLFGEVECDGFAIDIELIHNALEKGYSVEERGMTLWRDVSGSKVNPLRDGIIMLLFTASLCVRSCFSKANKKSSSHSRAGSIYLLLGVILCIRLATLGTTPLTDPSEGRYATIAAEMSDTGDYVTPMIWMHGKCVPFWGKPPLSFWMGSICFNIFGKNEFAARLPSFLSSMVLLLLVYWIVRRYRSKREAELAMLVISTCGGFFVISGVVLQEMTLTLFASGAFLFYYGFICEKKPFIQKWMSVGVFIFLALGFMTKGPVALVIFGVPVFMWHLLNRRWRILGRHAWVTGGMLFLIIAAPWFLIAEKKTPGFLHYFFMSENFYRFFKKDYGDLYGSGHKFPHGADIVFFLVIAAPWSLISFALFFEHIWKRTGSLKNKLISLWHSINVSKTFQDGEVDFFLLGFLGLILFWSMARQLSLYYMLQAIPAFGIWLASYMAYCGISIKRLLVVGWMAALLYLGAQILMPMVMPERKSTKSILSKAVRIRKELKISGKIVFARKIPYSAFFYAKPLIIFHKKESVNDSFTHNKVNRGEDNKNLYIVRAHHVKRIKSTLRNKIKELYSSTDWKIFMYDASFRKKKGIKLRDY